MIWCTPKKQIALPSRQHGFLLNPYRFAPAIPGNLDAYTTGMTAAWSMGRKLLTAYGGALYTDASGKVSSLNDQTGNSRHAVQASAPQQPVIVSAGPNSRIAMDFVSAGSLQVGSALSNFITNSAGYVIASCILDSVTESGGAAWQRPAVWSNLGAYAGAHVGTGPAYRPYNWDGNSDAASIAFSLGAPLVLEWKHEGGNVSGRINGGTWSSVASGNTQVVTGNFVIGLGNGTIDGQIFELATWSTIPSSGDQDVICSIFKNWIGA